MDNKVPDTQGAHHVGLTVPNIEETARFFTELLGWREVGGNPDYPALFVADGNLMITLWEVKSNQPRAFDKNKNIGLHHLALHVDSFERLEEVHETLTTAGVEIEFPPESLRDGPIKHMMCYEPGGIRLEFIHMPR